MSAAYTPGLWVRYEPTTGTYETPDGTCVAAELVDNVECFADFVHIALIREQQRAAIAKTTGSAA